jgi:hypothetical protein
MRTADFKPPMPLPIRSGTGLYGDILRQIRGNEAECRAKYTGDHHHLARHTVQTAPPRFRPDGSGGRKEAGPQVVAIGDMFAPRSPSRTPTLLCFARRAETLIRAAMRPRRSLTRMWANSRREDLNLRDPGLELGEPHPIQLEPSHVPANNGFGLARISASFHPGQSPPHHATVSPGPSATRPVSMFFHSCPSGWGKLS